MFLLPGEAMLKAVLSWVEVLLWMPVIGFFVVLVSLFPEYRRSQ